MSGYSAVSKNIEEIVKQHEGLVRRVAHHVHGRVHSVVEYDDLLQIGFIGLIQAAQRYTPQEGVTFPNYAVLRVRGAMYDYLRKNSNLCRKSIRMQQQTRVARDNLRRDLQREPSQGEVAQALNLTGTELAEWEHIMAANFNSSLDEVYDEYSTFFASKDTSAEQKIDQNTLRETLLVALKDLSEREALVLQLYYVEEFNIYEVAATLDISPGRVSQLKSSAFKRMREALGGDFEKLI